MLANRVLLLGLVVETLLVIVLTYASFLHPVFGTLDLDGVYWLPTLPFW